MKRVAFTISCMDGINTGYGGHYYSLKTLIDALPATTMWHVVLIGGLRSPLFHEDDPKVDYIDFNGSNLGTASVRVCEVIRSFQPDVIHSFDAGSFLFARYAAMKLKTGVVLTKCGGPNPKWYYPASKHLITYSRENQEHFEKRRRRSHRSTYFMPARVVRVEPDFTRVAALREMHDKNGTTIMRIGRICRQYERGLLQMIKLIKRLRRDGIGAHGIIIGTVQDMSTYKKVMEAGGSVVSVYTEDEFTRKASQLYPVADAVIGTGRSLMEASAFGKFLMSPMSIGDIPVAVTEGNFMDLERTNYSNRNSLANYDEEANYNVIRRVLTDREAMSDAQLFSKRLFDRYNIRNAIPALMRIYDGCSYEGIKIREVIDGGVHAAIIFVRAQYYRYRAS